MLDKEELHRLQRVDEMTLFDCIPEQLKPLGREFCVPSWVLILLWEDRWKYMSPLDLENVVERLCKMSYGAAEHKLMMMVEDALPNVRSAEQSYSSRREAVLSRTDLRPPRGVSSPTIGVDLARQPDFTVVHPHPRRRATPEEIAAYRPKRRIDR